MRTNWLMLLTMLLGVTVIGCGPRIDDDELGTILYRIPDVPGADKRVVIEPWPDAEEEPKDQHVPAANHTDDQADGDENPPADDSPEPTSVATPRKPH